MVTAKGSTASGSTVSGASASGSRRARRSTSKSSTITKQTLPRSRAPTHPGEMLLEEFLVPAGRTQADLARQLHKTPAAINELVKGKRGVTAEMALLLAAALGTTAEFWLNLQMSWDLWHARQVMKDSGLREGRAFRSVVLRGR